MSRDSTGKFGSAKDDRWQYRQSTTLNFTGRHCLPIWRIFRSDFKLTRYTLEHVVQNVLQQRVPHYSTSTLTSWGKSDRASDLRRLLDYYMSRTELDIELIEQAEVIPQTSEFARVFGIDFNSVRVRGSQFKVESVMLRIAKPESLLLLSPNRAQVGKQNAAECQPLIMEPQSAFYKGPVLVLDFQSLYPSVMCAYNLWCVRQLAYIPLATDAVYAATRLALDESQTTRARRSWASRTWTCRLARLRCSRTTSRSRRMGSPLSSRTSARVCSPRCSQSFSTLA